MRLASARRRSHTLPGITGVARLDRRTARLAGRLNPGDVAVIEHVDLDRVAAEALVAARPAAIVNAAPSISGRYPNLGPQVIADHGIPLVDDVGPEVFAAVKEGTRVRVDGDTVYLGDQPVGSGTAQDTDTVRALMLDAKAGLAAQLEAFAVNTAEFMTTERALLVDGDGVPALRTPVQGHHVVVAVRGHGWERDLKSLRRYIREYHPVLIGVESGADALVEAGLRPQVIVGDVDAVSDATLTSGAEIIVHAGPDGRAPSLARVQDLGVDAITFPTAGTAEDAALLIADENGADLVVTVGSYGTLTEFLDRGREGMASGFLTRLRLGAKLVDAHSVPLLYRTRVSAAALLLLVVAAFVAILAALTVSDAGRTYVGSFTSDWTHLVDRIQDAFS